MKLSRNLDCLKTRLDLESSSPALNKHWCCKNYVQLTMGMSILSSLCENFADCILLNVELKHSRSNLVFEIRNISIFRMLY